MIVISCRLGLVKFVVFPACGVGDAVIQSCPSFQHGKTAADYASSELAAKMQEVGLVFLVVFSSLPSSSLTTAPLLSNSGSKLHFKPPRLSETNQLRRQ